MRVLVLGGTGYVGRRITERLLEAGHDVAVVSRGRLHPTVLDHVEHLQLDRKDRAAFEAAFLGRQFDAVMDNIAYERDDAISAIRAFRGRAGQYLFTSSVAVYNRRDLPRPLVESEADLTHSPSEAGEDSTAFHPTRGEAYAVGKRQVELEFERHGSDLAFTSLRAPVVVGPDDRTLRVWWFVQRLQDGGPIIVPDWGPGRVFQLVSADDLAGAFLLALGRPAAYCRAYNIAEPDLLVPEVWIESLARGLGLTAKAVRIPESLLAPAGLGGYTLPIAGRPLGQVLLDTSAAQRELGFNPMPFETWTSVTARGCAGSPPAADSEGYGARQTEIATARRFSALREELQRRFAADAG